ncbi:MAG: endoglucanase [Abditibacteriota bacterium]|nr:endoglucanase [Abditibacteriota bacterium]
MNPFFRRIVLTISFVLVSAPHCVWAAPTKPMVASAKWDGASELVMPAVGAHHLRILSSTLLELTLITTKQPESRIEQWNWVNDQNQLQLPQTTAFKVLCNGQPREVVRSGFKRRVLYAPLAKRDLRIHNALYLELAQSLPGGASVAVQSTLWPQTLRFETKLDAMRVSPAIHVNQVGYGSSLPKKAVVGYYLGSLGEWEIPAPHLFRLVNRVNGKVAFEGRLVPRRDEGYTYTVKPYQQVLEADFSTFQTAGTYRLLVPGLGTSRPFSVGDGVAAVFARTYALGFYHQRCGGENELPFSRFPHAACHVAAADVPTPQFAKMQAKLASMSSDFGRNPRHTAPQLKDTSASLYSFVRSGKIDVSGGHHDAGDYSKYTINSAQLVHHLVFAADAFPGVASLDNLGLPESGDGRSDVLQIAKWEADFLAKMQDDDGGFYFLVYPRDRAYENDVLPDQGDPQIVFPKTTAATAAAVAALAQTASSPLFRQQFPQAAASYLEKAKRGWAFLQRAIEKHGRDGAYQKLTHYGDTFMHDDELAWAATEIYLATGDISAHRVLLAGFDPSHRDTLRWGWQRLFEAYGCAIRSYAFAARIQRVKVDALDAAHIKKCHEQLLLGGEEQAGYAARNAYNHSFPIESKRFRSAGWYFPMSESFDIAVAAQLEARPQWLEAIAGNLNYEGGSNPNNVAFLTGVGWKRQREVVHHYAQNDRRVLPPSGLPLGAVQEGFAYIEPYKKELGLLTFPADGDANNPYPFYDRWGDSFNTSTEFVVVNQARGLATLAWLMARTPLAKQLWRAASAKISGVPATASAGRAITAQLDVPGRDISSAQIVWEVAGQEPTFGRQHTFTPQQAGAQWIEAEAQWPDGRRAFAAFEFQVK